MVKSVNVDHICVVSHAILKMSAGEVVSDSHNLHIYSKYGFLNKKKHIVTPSMVVKHFQRGVTDQNIQNFVEIMSQQLA